MIQSTRPATGHEPQTAPSVTPTWEPPRFEVIALDCEITSYAPDDQPLF